MLILGALLVFEIVRQVVEDIAVGLVIPVGHIVKGGLCHRVALRLVWRFAGGVWAGLAL